MSWMVAAIDFSPTPVALEDKLAEIPSAEALAAPQASCP